MAISTTAAIVGAAVIGAGASLSAASSARGAAKGSAEEQRESFRLTSEEQFGITIKGQETRFGLRERGLLLEQSQDELFTRLRKIQIRQQADIAVARRRTQQQGVRISGVGGSFTRTRGGESEIQTEVQRQLSQLQIERESRQLQRDIEFDVASAEKRLGRLQAEVTRSAGIRGASQAAAAATTAADIGFVQASTGAAVGLAQNPAVVGAISNFFTPAPVSTGATSLITPTNPLGLTSGQGL